MGMFVHLKGKYEREAAILWGMGKEKAMDNVVRKQKMGGEVSQREQQPGKGNLREKESHSYNDIGSKTHYTAC